MFKLKELEGDMGEVIQSLADNSPMVLIEEDSFQQIWREQGCVHIADLGIDVYGATSCIYDENIKDYELSSSLYVFYEHGTADEVYFEYGSSLPVCVHNYAHAIGRTDLQEMDAVGELGCVYVLDGQKDWNKKQ